MVFIQERKRNMKTYIYLSESFRTKDRIIKVSEYIGEKDKYSKKQIQDKIEKLKPKINNKLLSIITKKAESQFKRLEYPLSMEEIKKIEGMNLKYKKIRKSLNKKDWIDIKKRFIANFVFESNALEGNSLTLKNFSDIIFKNRTNASVDLREVHDAKNSYSVFSKLFDARKEINESFIINLHKKIVKNIDDRIGYKKIPNILLGRNIKLTSPEDVPREMKDLISWYEENKEKVYPIELAFKFHHKFELIHPFADGNGRVGRMLLNYILIKNGYFPIIIRRTQRNKYIKALQAADLKRYIPLIRFALRKTKDTYSKFFEVYYEYIV